MKKYKIYEEVFCKGKFAMAEVIFSYPEFKSLEEGLEYIRNVLSFPRYGIVIEKNES